MLAGAFLLYQYKYLSPAEEIVAEKNEEQSIDDWLYQQKAFPYDKTDRVAQRKAGQSISKILPPIVTGPIKFQSSISVVLAFLFFNFCASAD